MTFPWRIETDNKNKSTFLMRDVSSVPEGWTLILILFHTLNSLLEKVVFTETQQYILIWFRSHARGHTHTIFIKGFRHIKGADSYSK